MMNARTGDARSVGRHRDDEVERATELSHPSVRRNALLLYSVALDLLSLALCLLATAHEICGEIYQS